MKRARNHCGYTLYLKWWETSCSMFTDMYFCMDGYCWTHQFNFHSNSKNATSILPSTLLGYAFHSQGASNQSKAKQTSTGFHRYHSPFWQPKTQVYHECFVIGEDFVMSCTITMSCAVKWALEKST